MKKTTVKGDVGTQMEAGIDKYGWCRTVGHQWKPPRTTGNGVLTVSKGIVRIELRCANGCTTKRVDLIAMRTGELVSREYTHPKDYVLSVPKDEERPRRDDWRKLHYKNLIGGSR